MLAEPVDANGAGVHYRQSLLEAGDLSMHPLIAHSHLGLGKFYARTSKQQRAREHVTSATTMYREMDMRFWLEQAESEPKGLP